MPCCKAHDVCADSVVVITRRCQRLNPGSSPGRRIRKYSSPPSSETSFPGTVYPRRRSAHVPLQRSSPGAAGRRDGAHLTLAAHSRPHAGQPGAGEHVFIPPTGRDAAMNTAYLGLGHLLLVATNVDSLRTVLRVAGNAGPLASRLPRRVWRGMHTQIPNRNHRLPGAVGDTSSRMPSSPPRFTGRCRRESPPSFP